MDRLDRSAEKEAGAGTGPRSMIQRSNDGKTSGVTRRNTRRHGAAIFSARGFAIIHMLLKSYAILTSFYAGNLPETVTDKTLVWSVS